ncbi:MAG: FAD-dependent oxidoreductase, partial [Oscillospiraceae bacterium]|nr:FAD-dependent oxidoreductase [Oscillospiraceae bacterium]
PLFTPFTIRKTEIKNRYYMAPMGTTTHNDEDGAYLPDAVDHYVKRAAGGVGLIITGANWVDNNIEVHSPGSFPCPTICPGKYIKSARELTDRVHAFGTKIFVQLTAGLGRSAMPAMIHDRKFVAPTTVSNRWNPRIECRELTTEEVERIVEQFGVSAAIAKRCGYDGVEVHAVHEGYLLDCFAMSLFNKRTDKYGGDLRGRLTFAIEIVQKIKKYCGEDFPVILRFSLKSYIKDIRQGAVPGEEFPELGRDTEEGLEAAKILVEAGYDALDVDAGTYDSWYWAHPPMYMPQNCNLEDVAHIKQVVDIPVVCAGRMEPDAAAEAIAEGKIDGMGVARQFLADPEWVTKLIEDRLEDIRPCICCHAGCFNFSSSKGHYNTQDLTDTMGLARCAINAETMQSKKHYIKPAKKSKTVAVIGGGIGGMEAALVCAKRGHKVTLYEKSGELGGVFIAAASPSFKEKDRGLIAWYRRELSKYPIEVKLNSEVKSLADVKADEVIVATGSTPNRIPIPGFEKGIQAVDFLLGKREVGEKVTIIGGGLTGCEIAYELYLQGKQPTIVEMQDDLVTTPGVCLANTSFLRDFFKTNNVSVHLETSVCEIQDDGVVVKDKNGMTYKIAADNVILSVGYKPAPIAAKAKNIHIIGDADKVGNLRSVIWGAWDVCMKI